MTLTTLSKLPGPALAPYVVRLWTTEAPPQRPAGDLLLRERVLPTGLMHLVIRLGTTPLRLFRDTADRQGQGQGLAIIGGVREGAYLRDPRQDGPMVGAVIRPGAATALLGAPAAAFGAAHTLLEDAWGHGVVARLRDRLAGAPTARERLALFEGALTGRLAHGAQPPDPLVARGIRLLARGLPVGALVAESGWSHRLVTTRFKEAVGMTPRRWCRVRRFSRTISLLEREPSIPLAELAALAGYADQPHLTREFNAMAGLTPGQYLRLAEPGSRHVPLPGT